MFSTVLKEVTGYFDRRVLVSTFFPTLVFLAGTLLAVLLIEIGRADLVAGWNRLAGTVQAILVAGLLVLVGFWTFAFVNLRDSLERLYQGYWPDAGPAAAVAKRWRDGFERRRNHLIEEDEGLESRAKVVRYEQEGLPNQEDILASDPPPAPGGDPAAAVEQAIAGLRRRLTALEATGGQANPATEHPAGLAEELRAAWLLVPREFRDAVPEDGTRWGRRLGELTQVHERLEEALKRLDRVLLERRLHLHRDLFLCFPAAPETVMPTALGNLLKAAEWYPRERYRLDAVVIWSRLQPLLPSAFADLLQQAKTSLDLLLTLATYTWLFGVPLALWTAVRAAWPAGSPAVVALAVLGAAGAIPTLAGRRARRPAQVAATAVLVAALTTLVLAWLPGGSAGRAVTLRAGVLLLLVAAIALLGWAFYRNAVQAGLGYGEKLKAAFDLHRWLVLDQLHLRRPADLTAEQALWDELSTMLYRGTAPSPAFYQYTADEQAKSVASPAVRVWVPVQDLPAYRPVAGGDLELADLPAADVPADAAKPESDLTGRRPLVPLPAGRPILGRVLVDGCRLDGTATLGVVARAAALEGHVGVGDLVDLLAIRQAPPGRGRLEAVFEDLLVVGVAAAAPAEGTLQLVVAVPIAQRTRLVDATRRATMLVSRKLPGGGQAPAAAGPGGGG